MLEGDSRFPGDVFQLGNLSSGANGSLRPRSGGCRRIVSFLTKRQMDSAQHQCSRVEDSNDSRFSQRSVLKMRSWKYVLESIWRSPLALPRLAALIFSQKSNSRSAPAVRLSLRQAACSWQCTSSGGGLKRAALSRLGGGVLPFPIVHQYFRILVLGMGMFGLRRPSSNSVLASAGPDHRR